MLALSRFILNLSTVFAAARAEAVEDDCSSGSCNVELLQKHIEVHATKSKYELQPQARQQVKVKEVFNCSAYPEVCAEPFNCQHFCSTANCTRPDDLIEASQMFGAIAIDGKPNLQSWCGSPAYHEYASQCIADRDLVKAAHTQYDNTKAGMHGVSTFQLDGSYCFIDGHCLNQAVSKDTTSEEANAQCDARYGRTAWTTIGDPLANESIAFAAGYGKIMQQGNQSNGFTGQEQTRGFLLLACAMGNYHCDVMYCKETYCKDPEMITKYSYFLEDLEWTKNTEEWFTGASK